MQARTHGHQPVGPRHHQALRRQGDPALVTEAEFRRIGVVACFEPSSPVRSRCGGLRSLLGRPTASVPITPAPGPREGSGAGAVAQRDGGMGRGGAHRRIQSWMFACRPPRNSPPAGAAPNSIPWRESRHGPDGQNARRHGAAIELDHGSSCRQALIAGMPRMTEGLPRTSSRARRPAFWRRFPARPGTWPARHRHGGKSATWAPCGRRHCAAHAAALRPRPPGHPSPSSASDRHGAGLRANGLYGRHRAESGARSPRPAAPGPRRPLGAIVQTKTGERQGGSGFQSGQAVGRLVVIRSSILTCSRKTHEKLRAPQHVGIGTTRRL